ncbi:MAG: DHH family phosphoesterase [Patescibacteria group bacterium]
MEKKWNIKGTYSGDLTYDLLKIRNLDKSFLKPVNTSEIVNQIKWQIEDARDIIVKHIKKASPIVIYGDYDVDGVCATAILYKTVQKDLGYEKILTFIPDRFDDGYGLSEDSIEKVVKMVKEAYPLDPPGLLITVDCGITAVSACEHAKKIGFDILITDHHKKGEVLPKPNVLLWSDKLTGAGISYCLSLSLAGGRKEYLALAALATVADLQPLVNFNRSIIIEGLKEFYSMAPVGLKALIDISGIDTNKISTYELSWILTPRLNASGRLESALLSLNLLTNENATFVLDTARKLNEINYERQQKTKEMFDHAKNLDFTKDKVIVVSDPSYHEGVVGLVAGKLAQEFHKPAFVISSGAEICKGSGRSIEGIDIIELLRKSSNRFISIGGHPMACGFSFKTTDLTLVTNELKASAFSEIDERVLVSTLNIDLEIPLAMVTFLLCDEIALFEPFGFGNLEPVFVSNNVLVRDCKGVGADKRHLKFYFSDPQTKQSFNGIFFQGVEKLEGELPEQGSLVDLVFSPRKSLYNGRLSLDLHIKDLKIQK